MCLQKMSWNSRLLEMKRKLKVIQFKVSLILLILLNHLKLVSTSKTFSFNSFPSSSS